MCRKTNMTKEDVEFLKALFIIDMNNGFVNFGPMANPKYNDLVPEQQALIEMFREEDELVNFILENHDKNALEFVSYPEHCVEGTEEAKLIPEFQDEENKDNTRTYYKNSINGMLNRTLQDDIKSLERLKMIVLAGVCGDLCVMDFGRTLLRYLDEINHDLKVFVVKSCIDTFDAPGHNREEWLEIAYKVLEQAGAIVVEDVEDLKGKVKQLIK